MGQYNQGGTPIGVVLTDIDGNPVGSGGTGSSVQGTSADGAAVSGNPIRVAGQDNAGNLRTLATGTGGAITIGTTGSAVVATIVTGASDASSAASNGLLVGSYGRIFNGTTWDRLKKPNLTARIVSAVASTNATVVKASAGDLFRVTLYNANVSAARFLKLYNKATAPTVGTDVPVWTEYLPPQAKSVLVFETPLYFSAGISFALTTGGADNDTGALTAGDILNLNVAYA